MGFFDALTGKSAKKAARQAEAGFERQRQTAERSFDLAEPFIEQGQGASNLLADFLGSNGPDAQRIAFLNFQNDPGFKAQLEAGIEAIEGSAAASGLLNSGAAAKDLFSFGQRFKGDAFNNRINQLSGQAQQGLQGTGLGQNALIGVGNAQAQSGQARAGGTLGQANALRGLFDTGLNIAGKATGFATGNFF